MIKNLKLTKMLICLLTLSKLSLSLEISPQLGNIISESEMKILSNQGNTLLLERDKMLVKLSPIDRKDLEKQNDLLKNDGIDLYVNGLHSYKEYDYFTGIIPLESIGSNVMFEILYPKANEFSTHIWRNSYGKDLMHEYIFSIVKGEKLKSEYTSLLIEKKEDIARKEKLKNSLGKFDEIVKLPSNIKNYISLANEISLDRISKRNEFWIDSETEKYVFGKVTLRDQDKNLYMEQEFKKGLPHGKFKSYNEQNLKLMVEGQYEKGEKEGKWTYYYDNGNRKQIEVYKNGKLNGKFTSYYRNKEKEAIGEYENGQKQDKWILYYENGEKKEEGQYKNDEKIKKWKYYNTNGKLREEKKHSFTLF